MGGALTAVSPDFTRAEARGPVDELLGAAATLGGLLPFAAAFENCYPNEAAQPLVLDLMQMLWDGAGPTAMPSG